MTVGGEDIGRWLARQTERWGDLDTEQQRRLGELGGEARTAAGGEEGKSSGARSAAFERGVTAMRAFRAREGEAAVPARGHVEPTVIDGQEVPVKLGVWRSNMRSRRSALTVEQQAVLDELGV
ncbi:helicase associated domain-containing protein [Streptomyces sparsus]